VNKQLYKNTTEKTKDWTAKTQQISGVLRKGG
jgi:hypothetical protein